MRRTKEVVILAMLAGVSSVVKSDAPDLLKIHQNNHLNRKTLEKIIQQELQPSRDFAPISSFFDNYFSFKTPSQTAVDSVIKLDYKTYCERGTGLYAGELANRLGRIQTSGDYIYLDCVDAIKIVLNAEMSAAEVRRIFSNSKDSEGNFSTPFMVKYLIKRKGWGVYGCYDENEEKNLKNGVIRDPDLIIGRNKSGRAFYRSGEVVFSLDDLFPSAQADSLFKRLTLERGYAIGFQRDGGHCYVLVQRGLFEVHSNALPLGCASREKEILTAWDFHEGRHYPKSSIYVIAFPPLK